MKPLQEVEAIQYPMDGNKSIEYEKSVRCPINTPLSPKILPIVSLPLLIKNKKNRPKNIKFLKIQPLYIVLEAL